MVGMTRGMRKAKVAVTIDAEVLSWADGLVAQGVYESRSAAIETAIAALRRHERRVVLEAALAAGADDDVREQAALAEAGLAEWSAGLDALDGGYGR